MARLKAMRVSEFRERSPINRLALAELVTVINSRVLAKEPLLVDGVKIRLGRGGNLDLRISGKTLLRCLIGKLRVRYSAILTGVAKF